MDVMTDEEVMAVVGHEIGHVVHTDPKDAMKNAYLRSAVKNAAGASSDKVAKLTDSKLGAMAEAPWQAHNIHRSRKVKRMITGRVLCKERYRSVCNG